MKLATLNDGTRDGQLVVVSRDLTRYASADDVAPTLQAALDEWERLAPQLQALASDLESGSAQSRPFDQAAAHSPLPRAYQWADGSAYVNHVGAGAPGAWRRDARQLLDRPADVSGRFG